MGIGNHDYVKEKDFLDDVAKIAAAARAQVQSLHIGLDPSPEARLARRRRVLTQGDFQFFAHTYFPHHIRPPMSLFHQAFFTRFPKVLRVPDGVKDWWIAPRGEAKSSLLTKVGPCYVAVQALLQDTSLHDQLEWEGDLPYFIDYTLMLGAETRLPSKLLEVVKIELTVNAALAFDFPEVCGRGDQWKIGEFITRNGVKFESFGAEQAVRGTFHGSSRPKLLLADDIITDKEAKSPTERNNRWDWLEKAIDYLGPPEGNVKYMAVNTILDKDDPPSRAKNTVGHLVHHFRAIEKFPTHMDLWAECEERMLNDDKPVMQEFADRGEIAPDTALPSFQFYADNKAEMDEGAVISWPGVRSLFWLMRQRRKNLRAFNTELQGDPRSDEDKVFTPIKMWVMKSHTWKWYAAVDPSVGRGRTSDPSAIIVGGYDPFHAKLNIVECVIKRRKPSKLESDVITAQREFKTLAFGFENNGAFETQRQNIIREATRQGVTMPLVPITSSVEQEVRIDSLEPLITDAFDPRILFHPGLIALLNEMDSWPEPQSGHHYDGLSALDILWLVVMRHVGGRGGITSIPRRGSESNGSTAPSRYAARDSRRFV